MEMEFPEIERTRIKVSSFLKEFYFIDRFTNIPKVGLLRGGEVTSQQRS